MALNVQPSILKTKAGHLPESANNDDQFRDFTLLTEAANTVASNNGNYANNYTPSKRKKQDPKTGKGLRHFSMKVCEKVKLKGVTTYNEVADELVAEFSNDIAALNGSMNSTFQNNSFNNDNQEPFDQKNIRRRVYDALNVLMAMNIISKEKKEIRWIGLPTNSTQECTDLEQEKQERLKRIKIKKQQLRDLLLQQIAFKNLVERNKNFNQLPTANAIIKLPFIIVNTDKSTVIDCSISNDKSEYLFNFDNTFEIHDDIEVLKRMGLAHHLEKDYYVNVDKDALEKAKSILPEALRSELEEMIDERENQLVVSKSPTEDSDYQSTDL